MVMTIKYDEDIERECMRCGEYLSSWQSGRELLCKYCEWAKRTVGQSVDLTYLEAVIR